jgi:hypothetical protein
VPLFIIASVMHPLAIGLVQVLIPRVESLTRNAGTRS